MAVVTSSEPLSQTEKIKILKQDRDTKIRAAEQAAHAYFAECDVGPERYRASDVYENLRNATRV